MKCWDLTRSLPLYAKLAKGGNLIVLAPITQVVVSRAPAQAAAHACFCKCSSVEEGRSRAHAHTFSCSKLVLKCFLSHRCLFWSQSSMQCDPLLYQAMCSALLHSAFCLQSRSYLLFKGMLYISLESSVRVTDFCTIHSHHLDV